MWIFSLLKYTENCMPGSPISFKSCSKVCQGSYFQSPFLRSRLPSSLLWLFLTPFPSLLVSIAVITIWPTTMDIGLFWFLFIGISPPQGQEFLLFLAVSITLTRVSGTFCDSINICEWMNEWMSITDYNHIVCKTSDFSMCLQSILCGWWCFRAKCLHKLNVSMLSSCS